MKTSFYSLFIGLLLIFVSCKKENVLVKTFDRNAIVDSTINAFQTKFLQQQIDSVFSKYQFNGSVVVFKDSAEIYRKNQGFSNFDKKTPIDSLTDFAIASISKQFTAALILQQVEQGKLKLDDSVSKYLTDFEKPDYKNITVKQLLNHTSGLNMMGQKLMFKSGEDFHYSNDGYNALGKIIEKISGKSFDENAAALFKELGLKNTFVANDFQGSQFGSAYLGNTKTWSEVHNMPKRLAGSDVGTPAGGILSTVDDLHLWNQLLYGGKILKPETLREMTTKTATRMHQILGKMGYGYGLMMNDAAPQAFFHSGYVKGSPGLNIYYPATKTSVIILSNIADEGKGKNSIFSPHKEIKRITDATEITIGELRKDLITPMKEESSQK